MSGRKVTYLIGVITTISLLTVSCKKVPSLSPENEMDPQNENFRPASAENLSLNFDDESNQIVLQWLLHPEEAEYIDGYIIDKRESPNSPFKQIQDKKITDAIYNGIIRTLRFTDPKPFNGIYTEYKIRSYIIQQKDTAFSEAKYLSKSFNSQNNSIHAVVFPFIEPPVMELSINLDDITAEAEIEIYSKADAANDYNLITKFSAGETGAELEFDVYQSVPDYYFRITLDSVSTEFLPIITHYQDMTPVTPVITDIQGLSKNEIAINFEFPSDSSSSNFELDTYTVQLYEVTIVQDSSFTLISEIINPFTVEPITETINNLDTSKTYELRVFGSRGVYSTSKDSEVIGYSLLGMPLKEIDYTIPNYFRSEIYFDANSERVLISKLNDHPQIFDLNEKRVVQTLQSGSLYNAPFASGKFMGDDKIITYSTDNYVRVWDANSYSLISTLPRYPADTTIYAPRTFDILSSSKLLLTYVEYSVDYETPITGDLYVVIWDFDTQSYQEIYADTVGSSIELIFNEQQNLIHLYYPFTDQYIEEYNTQAYGMLVNIDSETHEVLVKKTTIFRKYFTNMALGHSGEQLYMYANRATTYSVYDATTLQLISDNVPVENSENLSLISTAGHSDLVCFSTYTGSLSAVVRCTETPLAENRTYAFELYGGRNGIMNIGLDNSGETLVAVNEDKVYVKDFINRWVILYPH